jgi:Chlorophyll A-B binding protein
MVGDFGFDPLGLTNTLSSTSYVQAAELKHGRVAMLATVGFVFQQYLHIVSDESNPIKAVGSLGYMPNLQILSLIGLIELATWDKTFSGETPGTIFIYSLQSLRLLRYLTIHIVIATHLKSSCSFFFLSLSFTFLLIGDLGFDPMGQMKGKSAQQINDLKLKEVKNGRLAMIAIIGMITQNIIFDGKPTLSF